MADQAPDLQSPDSITDHVRSLMHRSHGDMLKILSVADMANMQQRQQSNMDRMNAQVDAQLRKCNPDYASPVDDGNSTTFINAGMMTIEQAEAQMNAEDDGMGNRTFINAGLMVDANTAKGLMAQAVKESSGATATATSTTGIPVLPVPPVVPEVVVPAVKRGARSLLWAGAKQVVPLLAVAGLSIAAARYFSPQDTDTNSQYSIEAQPYVPDTSPPQ